MAGNASIHHMVDSIEWIRIVMMAMKVLVITMLVMKVLEIEMLVI